MTLPSLRAGQQHVEVAQAGKLSVIMLFQPQCSWCKKQAQQLTQLQQRCQHQFHISLVGTNGSKRQLKRSLKHYDDELLAAKASKVFLRKIGGFKASPTTIFYDQNGNEVAKRRGYIQLDKFKNAIKLLSKGECHI
ncbi:thioredoxin fold domain-containing protein [Parashewanella tropica]|uniref:thioredoxin fold domain-containing protein n=1 Tax=Parashewanella tropica TaxID=2547970 RepID=UPI001478F589|nr:thioredoxin fold domain-containing protein [Parashewanella tropica]